ncbi:MAG TPA: UDP-3-O-(3-hydroxymyristoyl)glucosamine N-acyltransferase, partial [Thiothrix sp.]|nr:UDP-3-O-(3-hydroxymyristoyl)glucosamine N-acyltransferase [Thiothrix sp.]
MKLVDLAKAINARCVGDETCDIQTVAEPHQAKQGDVIFVRDSKYRHLLNSTKASAVILPPKLAGDYQGNQLITDNPYLAYAKAVTVLHPVIKKIGIHPTAVIADNVQLGEEIFVGAHTVIEAGCQLADRVQIGAGCYLGEQTKLGADSELHPHVTLAARSDIGQRCLIHSGAVIGADGFGLAPQADQSWFKIPQIGQVVLGNDVEVGANTTIDRAAFGVTKIGQGVKLDNLIQIVHNGEIVDHSAIAAHAAIAGSTKIGQYCQIGGAAVIAGHLTIANHCIILGT